MDWVNPETTAQNVIAPPNTRFLLETGDLSQTPSPYPIPVQPWVQNLATSTPLKHSHISLPWLEQRTGSGGGGYGCWELK